MKLPRVLIFTVTYEGKEYAREKFMQHFNAITYPKEFYRHVWIDNSKDKSYYTKLKNLYGDADVFYVNRGNNTREALSRGQNLARQLAINNDYDYILSLESDILVTPNIIQDLLKSAKDVITALYFLGDRDKGERIPCITIPEFNEGLGAWGSRLLKPEEFKDYINNGLIKAHAGGMGCCLISKNIFTKFHFYYDPRFKGHSDIYFFQDCFINKIPVYVNTDLICDHINSDWRKVSDR